MAFNRKEVEKIWENVKANHKALDHCRGPHDFHVHEKLRGGTPRNYKCSKCGGVLDSVNYYWYKKGIEHGLQTSQRSPEPPDSVRPSS